MTDDAEANVAKLIAEAEEFTPTEAINSGLPRLHVDRANPDRTVASLRDILAKREDVFERGVPVRMVIDKSFGGVVAKALTPETVVLLAHQSCRPFIRKQSKDALPTECDTALPRPLAAMYLDWHGEWQLPVLNGTTSAPILGDDGSIRSASGYDPISGFCLVKVPDLSRMVPLSPTRSDAEAALRRLRRQFATFCFADAITELVPDIDVPLVNLELPPGDDESAFLAAVMTAICRPSLPLAPGILIRAAALSGAGSGKGLLARCISLIAFGNEPAAVTVGGNSQELEKRLAAELIGGSPVLFLDNVNDRSLKSDLLASAITERPARVRMLGKSEMMPLNASAFVVITGNGLNVSEDLARRFIFIDLDSRTEDPEARAFVGDLQAEVRQHRAELMAAALTIWRWGRLQANALTAGKPTGSFEPWGRWIRDPLLELGCRDPIQRTTEAKQRDIRRQEIRDIFERWQHCHSTQAVTSEKLSDMVKEAIDPQGRGRQYIASRLEKLAGTRLAGFVMTRQKSARWSAATYALLPASEEDRHRGHRGHE